MTQGGFYERKRMSPTAVAVVVLLHGAAITALVMAKEPGFIRDITRTTLIDIHPVKPPPPQDPKPPKPQPRQPIEQITSVRPVDPPPMPTWTVPPPPPLPPQPTLVVGQDPPFVTPTISPPPPPQPEVKLQPARARANLGSYVSDADYPTDAIRREEQGATRFKLAVGPDGRVTSCTVTASSGSAALDLATCRLMKSRARFAPARDSSGNAVADAVSSMIVWRLPNG
jgi:protein TonB